jgi:hypothetical protein
MTMVNKVLLDVNWRVLRINWLSESGVKSIMSNLALHTVVKALRADRRGQIALMFALSAVTIVTGVGAGVDLMRAYVVQQKMTHVATLTCQYASVLSVVQTSATSYLGYGSPQLYISNVTGQLDNLWNDQGIQYAQTTTTPVASNGNGLTTVSVTTTVPTAFMQIIGVTTIPVAVTTDCYSGNPTSPPPGTPLVQEGFESQPCGANKVCYISPTGKLSGDEKVPASPSSYSPTNAGYTGSNGTKWYITGYCLETDAVGFINASVPEGQTAAELDCDNGYGTAGNSAISTQAYMEYGNYEVRWWYRSRIDYPVYDPAYICGSSAADTSWANANDDNFPTPAGDTRSNQINVYLDKPTSNGAPPFHYTLDGQVQLAGSNLIDTCVYSPTWIERSVRVKITTPGFYWLTFAADGANDSFGGQIDDLRLCQGSCAGSPHDNFPTAWLPANNGGQNKVLFQDTFNSPTYADDTGLGANVTGNLNNSTGTSGTGSSGWPTAGSSGWTTAPLNQVIYNTANGALSTQSVWLANANGQPGRVMARPMLLVPGYYNLSYYYQSQAIFNGLSGVYCGATPSAARLSGLSGSGAGVLRNSTYAVSGPYLGNALAAFIASAQLVSTPNGSGALNSTTSFTNPDSNASDTPPVTSTSTTPSSPIDSISLTNYTASTKSALLDVCGFSSSWTNRSVNFQITKSGYYWLAFSTEMASTGSIAAGAVDNVTVTALGSPAMLSPPSNPVVVPTAGPAPSSQQADPSGSFFIVADPPTFPAPFQ